MKNIPRKIIKVFTHPELWPSYFIMLIKGFQVKEVHQEGKTFYKYKEELYPAYLNDGNASSFIIPKALTYCKGNGIDVGADQWPLPGATPIQEKKSENAFCLDRFPDESLDYVFSSHCLEHLEPWQTALTLWIKKLKNNGYLFLYLPHSSMKLWEPGGPWAGLTHKWSPTHETINAFLKTQGMRIIDFDSGKDKYWSFYIIAQKQ